MGLARGWRSRWADAGRRIAAAPHATAVATAMLGGLAAAEALWHALPIHLSVSGTGGSGGAWQFAVIVLVLVSLATTLPLGFAQAGPAFAAVAISAASLLSLGLFQMLTVAGTAAQLAALYRLGRAALQLLAAGLAVPFLVLALVGSAGGETRLLTVMLAALAPAAAWAGIARRAHVEARAYRAAQQVIADTMLQHTAREERARMSRELHDVVAHHISMIAVQAETARLATPGLPAAGAQRLAAIGDTARAALTEMRRLLGVLRDDAQTGAADRLPQPGLGQLNKLLDDARDASGAQTRLIVRGRLPAVDPGVELAAYRIVQEALTNARRHAPGAAVDVELRYAGHALLVRIRDNGPGPPTAPASGGHGLRGMGERAAAVGGALHTAPAPGGGFLIEATLPAQAEGAP